VVNEIKTTFPTFYRLPILSARKICHTLKGISPIYRRFSASRNPPGSATLRLTDCGIKNVDDSLIEVGI